MVLWPKCMPMAPGLTTAATLAVRVMTLVRVLPWIVWVVHT